MPVDRAPLARAEGVVAGERRVEKVALVPTGKDGTWLVKRTWPEAGEWVLAFTLDHHGHATLVARPDGTTRHFDRPVTAAEIDAVRVASVN